MPENISRRRFIRQASVGAVAAGAVAVGGANLLAPAASAETAPDRSNDATQLEGAGLIAQVIDAGTGEISLLIGTREVRYMNRSMAQQLMRAAQ